MKRMPGHQGSAFAEIAETIRRTGPIPFDRFMEIALYHPVRGYYRRRDAGGGRSRGTASDYVTAPGISPLFGRLMGRLLGRTPTLIPGSAPVTILEIGGGDGRLASAALPELAAPVNAGEAIWVLSDIAYGSTFPPLPEGCFRVAADGMTPYRRLPRAILIANELFDALPCRLFRCRDGVFQEVMVGLDGDRLVERPGTEPPPEVETYIASLGLPPVEGAAIEISPRGGELVRQMGRLVERGFLVVIDYGGTGEEMAERAARGGTLRTFSDHSVMGKALDQPGSADLTFDVDFTELARWGMEAGWEPVYQGRQRDFLLALGLLDELIALSREASSTERLSRYLAAKRFLLEEGLQERFRVLILGRGLSVPPLRAGELLGLLEGGDGQ